MHLNSKLALWGLLVAMAPALGSCSSDKDPEVMNLQILNAQVSGFAISADSVSTLKNVAFTIRNAEVGEIYNATLLPYGTDLTKVKLDITPRNSLVKIEVALGNGAYAEWKKEQTYDLTSVSTINLKLTQEAGKDAPFVYTYKVSLRKHQFDPQTISWSRETATVAYPEDADPVWVLKGANSDSPALLAWSDDTHTPVYSVLQSGAWQAQPLSNWPAAQTPLSAVSNGSDTYILTDTHGLLRLNGNQLGSVNLPAGTVIESLLGAFEQRAGQTTVAAIISQDGKLYFASVRVGATPIVKVGAQVPQDFPVDGFATSDLSSSQYSYASLVVAGGRNSNGEVANTAWSTTNGEDWLKLADIPELRDGHHSLLRQGNEFYLISRSSTGALAIYHSDTSGRSWEKYKDIALTDLNQSGFSTAIAAYATSTANTIYLVGDVGVGGGNSSIWKGTLRRDE